VHLWTLRGVTFAVVICLDIEVPELSVALRGRGVDCLLVPSATESVLGVERVGRCASARAVELCCHVGVSQLVGHTDSELVDENVGRLAWLNPSQSPFLSAGRETISDLQDQGFHVMRCRLDASALASARANLSETNPSLLTPKAGSCEIVLHGSTNPPQP
jgi:predicted amidohydrolase